MLKSSHTTLISILIGISICLFLHRNQFKSIERKTSQKVIEKSREEHVEKRQTNILPIFKFRDPPFLKLKINSTRSIVPIIVLSKASNIEARDAIRRTWAFAKVFVNSSVELRTIFLVGNDDSINERIRAEQNLFDDIVQVDLPDSNSYLSYKELAAMIWLKRSFNEFRFYFKTEDTVILNVDRFLHTLIPFVEQFAHRSLVIGWFGPDFFVQRGDYQKFLDALFPTSLFVFQYPMQLFYAITLSAIDQMLDALSHIEQIDVPGEFFLTGILRHKVGIEIENLAKSLPSEKYVLSSGFCSTSFKENPQILFCTSSLQNGRLLTSHEYFDAWNVLISNQTIYSQNR